MLATVSLAANAADAPKPRTRTIPQLIELAQKLGDPDAVKPPLSALLGFKAEAKGKTLRYDPVKWADGKERAFTLVLEAGRPAALVWSVVGMTGDFQYGYRYRSTVAGRLTHAVEARGDKGSVDEVSLTLDERTKARFEKEVDRYLSGVAAEAPDTAATKGKSRTLEQLVDLAMKKGMDTTFPQALALGLRMDFIPKTRAIVLGPEGTSDGRQHQLHVVRNELRETFLWYSTRATTDETGMRRTDAKIFWSRLTGELISAVKLRGRFGEVEPEFLEITDPQVKDDFERERIFFQAESAGLLEK